MTSFNKVILVGNLTRDPELITTSNGNIICKFTIASTRHYTSQDKTKKEEVLFIDVDAFGRQADTINKYIAKGRPILIEGRLKLDQWETQSGDKRNKISITLESFRFIDNKQSKNESYYENLKGDFKSSVDSKQENTKRVDLFDENNEDIPF